MQVIFWKLAICGAQVAIEEVVHSHYCKIFTHVVPLEGKSLTQENVAM
jgi:hypothetical protein